MYQRRESAFHGDSNTPRYRLTSSLGFEPIQPDGEQRDPLYEFFSSEQNYGENKGIVNKHLLFVLPTLKM